VSRGGIRAGCRRNEGTVRTQASSDLVEVAQEFKSPNGTIPPFPDMPGTLFVVATPIGNLEDVTARALRVLREVAVIAAEDTRRTSHLLARYAITTSTTSLHEHNEHRKTPSLIERLRRGDDVALVSDAGTPTISDPGQQLISAAIKADIRVEAVPGPNAAIAALAVSGFPSDMFAFMGFPPTRSKDRKQWFERTRTIGGTVVFYEAPHRIQETLLQLQRTIGDQHVLVCRELTKKHEQLVRGPISAVLQELTVTKGELTVVVDIGHITDNASLEELSDTNALLEFGVLTNNSQISRRQAINIIAKRHNIPPNQIYESIERAKK
jgi:16S rRNA (cytidine1402-2'-O)-methyltransferase